MSHSPEKNSWKRLIINIAIDVFLLLIVIILIFNIKSCYQQRDAKEHYNQLIISLKNNDYAKAKEEFNYFHEHKQKNYENVNLLERQFGIDELKRTYAALPENALDERLSACRSLYRLEPNEKTHINCIKRLEEKIRVRKEEIAFKEKSRIMGADFKKSGQYKTKPNSIGATSKILLRRAIKVLSQGDKTAFEKFLRDNQSNIFILKGGDEVFLERMEGEYVKVRAKGSTVSFWTSRTALKNPK